MRWWGGGSGYCDGGKIKKKCTMLVIKALVVMDIIVVKLMW
jgi:hypothetical protein